MMCAAHLHVATNSGGAEVTFDTEQQTDIICTTPHHGVDGYLIKKQICVHAPFSHCNTQTH